MKDRVLSFKQIVGIIEASGKHGVAKLKFGTLEIDFHTQASPVIAEAPIDIVEVFKNWENPNIQTSAGSVQSETEEERLALQEEFIRAQELITDPAAHEEEMINLAAKEQR